MKICNTCKIEKDDGDFYKRKATGCLLSDCKECNKAKVKAKQRSNPELHTQKSKEYNDSHVEARRAYDKQRRLKNKERTKELNAKYHEANKEKINEKSRQFRLNLKESV